MHNDYVLVVGQGRLVDDTAAMLSATDLVERCSGTAAVDCPAVHGARCALRDEARVTVVVLAGEHEFHAPGQWSCITAAPTPAVAVLEGSSSPVRGSSGFAVVGSKSDPAGIAEAINLAVR